MAERSADPLSAAVGRTTREKSSTCTGRLVGEVISPTVPCASEKPVIAPQVLRLTSAVACCQLAFLAERTLITSFPVAGPPRRAAPVSGSASARCRPGDRPQNVLHLRRARVVRVLEEHADVLRCLGGRPHHPRLE